MTAASAGQHQAGALLRFRCANRQSTIRVTNATMPQKRTKKKTGERLIKYVESKIRSSQKPHRNCVSRGQVLGNSTLGRTRPVCSSVIDPLTMHSQGLWPSETRLRCGSPPGSTNVRLPQKQYALHEPQPETSYHPEKGP